MAPRRGRPREGPGAPALTVPAASAAPAGAHAPPSAPGGRIPGGGRLRLGPLAALAIILAAALLLHWPALRAPFFADDYLFLDQVGRGSLAQVLASPDPIGNFYRPVGRQLYFWLMARAAGGSPLVSHAVNLGLWLAVVALLFGVARRLAGARAAVIACGLLALHYAAEVPVRWASGSQDLLAVAGSLAALWLHLAGRRLWAGVTLLAALLSKEVVVLTPLVAVIAARAPGESWRAAARRAWPLAAAVAVWAWMAWSAAQARASSPGWPAITPAAAAAAFVHLVQVACGIEWGSSAAVRFPHAMPPLVPLALVLLAVGLGWNGGPGERAVGGPPSGRDARGPRVGRSAREAGAGRGVVAGLAWALAGAVPVAAVAEIWSAYYYLFALCGAALAAGSWLAPRGRGWPLAVVALVAWNSARSSALPVNALARDPWTTCSHINRHYLERGARAVERYLSHLRAARPTLPPRSTLFFTGIPGAVAFQASDGPLVRRAYGDTSLRSHYVNSFDLAKWRRGPVFFFEVRDDSLREMSGGSDQLYWMAMGAILSDQPRAAREMLEAAREMDPSSARTRYWLAWVDWDLGDRERALAGLRAAGLRTEAGPPPEIRAAFDALDARDTLRAMKLAQGAMERHVLHAGAHALISDLAQALGEDPRVGILEAYPARLLAPEWPTAWRRWAVIQYRQRRYPEAARSLRRYFDLAGAAATGDREAQDLANYLRKSYPVTARELDASRPAP